MAGTPDSGMIDPALDRERQSEGGPAAGVDACKSWCPFLFTTQAAWVAAPLPLEPLAGESPNQQLVARKQIGHKAVSAYKSRVVNGTGYI